ncbi:MAG: helix-turn-helix domain-containing protein [Ilumatobacter sp.]|nr:helix-turn-helix domain-containing protein [Ilumatobacter sp.]
MSQSVTSDPVPRAVGRVLDLLEIVLAAGACNLSAAAAAAELTPTTALRHLRALEARGYVRRDDGGNFSAGPTVMRIAASLHDTGPLARLATTAQPFLDELAATTGESTYLAVSDGTRATYVAAAVSGHAIRHVGWVGQTVPLTGTAVGEALDDPTRAAVRTGAVEPDITAISQALPTDGGPGIAISVIGPRHRLGAERRREVVKALGDVIDRLAADVGIGDMEASA